jgi:hypothetical protein
MKKVLASVWCVGCLIGATALSACGGQQKPATQTDPNEELKQLIALYNDARPKFVVQKEQMIKDTDCSRATRLREAIDKMAADAAMSTADTGGITAVQMELQQAEKECLAK